MLEIGITNSKEIIVENNMTAKYIGSGELDVYATPMMIALMENVAYSSILDDLEQGSTTVGTLMNIKHVKASPVGMKVICESELVEIDGRRLVFKVSAKDEKGIIGNGTHERYIVDSKKFIEKTYS